MGTGKIGTSLGRIFQIDPKETVILKEKNNPQNSANIILWYWKKMKGYFYNILF